MVSDLPVSSVFESETQPLQTARSHDAACLTRLQASPYLLPTLSPSLLLTTTFARSRSAVPLAFVFPSPSSTFSAIRNRVPHPELIMTLQTAIDITNLVCASLAFIYFAITQFVAIIVLHTKAQDERIIAKIARRRLREIGDDVHEWPPRDEFLSDAFRNVEPPFLLLSERSGILLLVTCGMMVVTFVSDCQRTHQTRG